MVYIDFDRKVAFLRKKIPDMPTEFYECMVRLAQKKNSFGDRIFNFQYDMKNCIEYLWDEEERRKKNITAEANDMLNQIYQQCDLLFRTQGLPPEIKRNIGSLRGAAKQSRRHNRSRRSKRRSRRSKRRRK